MGWELNLAVATPRSPVPLRRGARAPATAMPNRAKILQIAKGYRGRAKNCYRIAVRRVQKALQHAYKDRRLKRRDARRTWIMQLNGGATEHGLSYSRLIYGLKLEHIALDRKVLSILARHEPYTFRSIVEEAKNGLRKAVLGRPGPSGALLSGGERGAAADAGGVQMLGGADPPAEATAADSAAAESR